MKIVNAFIEPIVKDALAKRDRLKHLNLDMGVDVGMENGDDETFLDHLVNWTSGSF
jgi:hypothetical protein